MSHVVFPFYRWEEMRQKVNESQNVNEFQIIEIITVESSITTVYINMTIIPGDSFPGI